MLMKVFMRFSHTKGKKIICKKRKTLTASLRLKRVPLIKKRVTGREIFNRLGVKSVEFEMFLRHSNKYVQHARTWGPEPRTKVGTEDKVLEESAWSRWARSQKWTMLSTGREQNLEEEMALVDKLPGKRQKKLSGMEGPHYRSPSGMLFRKKPLLRKHTQRKNCFAHKEITSGLLRSQFPRTER